MRRPRTRSPKCGRSRAKQVRAIRTGPLSRPRALEVRVSLTMALRSRRASVSSLKQLVLLFGFFLAGCMHVQPMAPMPVPLRLSQIRFGELAGWTDSDPQRALVAFRGSCAALRQKPDTANLGGLYAGTAADWRAVCEAGAAAISAR